MNETYNKTLIMQENYDSDNVPFRPQITQIDSVTGCLTIITEQTVDEMQGLEIVSPTNLIQVYNETDLINKTNRYMVLHDRGQIKFSPDLKDEQILFKFYGKEAVFIADTRIYTTLSSDGTVVETLHDVIADARETLDLLKNGTDLVALSVTLNMDIENAQNEAEILENDIIVANQTDIKLKADTEIAKNQDAILNNTIGNAKAEDIVVNNTIKTANTAKANLDTSTQNSITAKANLDASNKTATDTKSALDLSNTNAIATKSALDTSKQNADTSNANLLATIASSDIAGMKADIKKISNLVQNGDFETGDLTGWAFSEYRNAGKVVLGWNFSNSASTYLLGTKSPYMIANATTDMDTGGTLSGQYISVKPNSKYILSYYRQLYRGKVTHEHSFYNGDTNLGYIFQDTNTTVIDEANRIVKGTLSEDFSTNGETSVNNTYWKRVVVTFTTPSNCNQIKLSWILQHSYSSAVFFVDNVRVEENQMATYLMDVLSNKQSILDTNLQTVSKNVIDAINELNPAGVIEFFARNTPPTGYLKCNGATLNRTTYARLFSAIGTTFGVGDGSTTFQLPDLRGYFLRGWDDGKGIDAGRAFGSLQTDDFKSHAHEQVATANPNSGGTGTIQTWSQGSPTSTGMVGYDQGVTTSPIGGTETRPKNIALLACIRY